MPHSVKIERSGLYGFCAPPRFETAPCLPVFQFATLPNRPSATLPGWPALGEGSRNSYKFPWTQTAGVRGTL